MIPHRPSFVQGQSYLDLSLIFHNYISVGIFVSLYGSQKLHTKFTDKLKQMGYFDDNKHNVSNYVINNAYGTC